MITDQLSLNTSNIIKVQTGSQEQNSRTFPGLFWSFSRAIIFHMQCLEKVFGAHGQSLAQTFLHTNIFLPFQVIFKDFPGFLLKFEHFQILENLPLKLKDFPGQY